MLITPPNKDEVIEAAENIQLKPSNDQEFSWGNRCLSKKERIEPTEIFQLIKPSFQIFKDSISNRSIGLKLTDAWRNIYYKGYHQEVHDHSDADLSAVLFLNDYEKGSGEFYFFDRYSSEINGIWDKILSRNDSINYKAGDIIFFPSYMLHGVTPLISGERVSFAFNFDMFFV